MTGRLSAPDAPRTHQLHPAYAAFLVDRLNEEIDAALTRTLNDRGLQMLVTTRNTLKRREKPDQASIDILTLLYADHPQFDPDWSPRPLS